MISMRAMVALLLSAVAFCGCSTTKKISAGAALPFAVMGDSVLLPFQGMGWASRSLIAQGDEHLAAVREEQGEKPTVFVAELTSGILYGPGYLFWPLDAAMPEEWYPMTTSCNAVLAADRAAGDGTNGMVRAPGGFKEW